MGLFSKRYLTIILSFFLVFSALAFFFGAKAFAVAIPVLLLVLSAFFLIFRKKIKNITVVLILIFIFSSVGGINSLIFCRRVDLIAEKYSGKAYISGYVAQVNYRSNYMSEYKVKVESVSGENEKFYAILRTGFDAELCVGDFFSAYVETSDLSSDDKDNYGYYDGDCIVLCTAEDEDSIGYGKSGFRLSLMLNELNSYFSMILTGNIKGTSGKMASALMLGKRDLLPDDVIRDFRRTGIYHILSLSGTHISIIVGIFEMLLKKVSVPKKIRFIILSFLAFFYVALTGFLPSACRSVFMLWFVYLSYCFGRKSDSLTSLFGAVSLIVAVSPQSIKDIGLLLSFVSTFSVIVSFMIISRIGFMVKDISGGKIKVCFVKLMRGIFASFLSSLCVSVLTLPIMYVFFGEMSLATFITNIFIGIICEVFMLLCLVVMSVSFCPSVLYLFSRAAEFCGDVMRMIISYISGFENIVLSLRYPFAGVMVWLLFVLTIILLTIKLKKVIVLLAPVASFALAFCIGITIFESLRADIITCEYVSEKSDDMFTLSCGGENYIIDFSDGDYYSLYRAVSLAENNCYTETDGVMITHYHKGHSDALERLCSCKTVRKIFLPKPETEDEFFTFSSISRKIDSEKTSLIMYSYDEPTDLGGATVIISRPSYDGKTVHSAQAMSLSFGKYLLTYAENGFFDDGIYYSDVWKKRFAESNEIIYGSHGRSGTHGICGIEFGENTKICFSDGVLYDDRYIVEYEVFYNVGYEKILMGGKNEAE